MQDCSRSGELLSALVDDELSEEEARELDTHLATCARCRSDLRLLQTLHEELGQALPDPPETLRSGIMYKVGLEKKRRFGAFWRWAASAAVFVFALLGVVKLTGNDLKSMRSVTADAAKSVASTVADAAADGFDYIRENDAAADESDAAGGVMTYAIAAPGAESPWPQPEGFAANAAAGNAVMPASTKQKSESDSAETADAEEDREFTSIYDASNLRGYDVGMEMLNGATAYSAVGIIYELPEGLPGRKWEEMIAPIGQRRWLVKRGIIDELAAENVFDELYFGDLLADSGLIIELMDEED